MNLLGLFSGIGGFELAASREGFNVVGVCEIEPYCRKVLSHRFPEAFLFDDVRSLSGEIVSLTTGKIDSITGGFPCQDISVAGSRKGLDGERSGLWFQMRRVIEEARPRWVLIENSPRLRRAGLDRILGALAALGYDAEWHCVPAGAIGAPHRRDRIYVTAWLASDADRSFLRDERGRGSGTDGQGARVAGHDGSQSILADTHGQSGGPWRESHSVEGSRGRDTDRGGEREGAVADPSSSGRGERYEQDPRGPLTGPDTAGGCASEFPDAVRPRLEIRRSLDYARLPANSGWRIAESDVGRSLAGFSSWLHGLELTDVQQELIRLATEKEIRPIQALQALRRAVQERAGRNQNELCSQKVLLAFVRELQERCDHEARILVACEEALDGSLRGLRRGPPATGAPHRPGPSEQHGGERPDALQDVSRLLAYHAEKAWVGYRRTDAGSRLGWEEGVSRVVQGFPGRVDRIRALGNAVVPQVAQVFLRAIRWAEESK